MKLMRTGPSTTAVVIATIVSLAAGVPAATLASIGRLPGVEPAEPAAAASTEFYSSFEAADPQPTWTNTAETDAQGNKKMSGVTGSPATGIPGNITDRVVEVTASGENPPNETKERAVDGNINTKWLVFTSTGWLQVKLAEPIAVVHYALTSANDAPERDPRDWILRGSQDGQTWTTLDTQVDQQFTARFQTKEYRFTNATPYLYYRLDITRNWGVTTTLIQLAELQLSNGDTTPPPPSDMKAFVSGGPVNGFNMKPNAGWTGIKALQYSGGHLPEGRAFAWDKVFEVDVLVTPTSVLSYLVFPEFTAADMDYPSTHVAVDLAFDDGTYLSDLVPTDQHFAELSPSGQGASKTVSVDQWNYKLARIGEVAAGRTAVRILVGYDNPSGPALFNGWIDDIRITASPATPDRSRPTDYAVTTRGTNSSGGFSRGNNFPAAAVPHGFNFWTPMTNAGSMSWLYEYQRATNADNLPTLQAFGLSHEPSPWMGDRQTFQVMPSAATGTPTGSRTGRALPFRHENETARPHYYGVTFENGIKTDLAPTDHAAILRFTFAGDSSNLIFDNVNNQGATTLDAANGVVTGYSDARSGLSTGATRIFIYGIVDRPVIASGALTGGGGSNVTRYFKFDTSGAAKTVTLRIATSLMSIDQARKNLELEIAPNDTLESVRERAQGTWDAKLGVIEVEGGTDDQLVTLYSNLYRLFLYPNSAHENTGTAANPVWRHTVQSSTTTPPSSPTQTGAPIVDGKVFVNNGFWDTYRTTWPAYALLTPSKAGEMIDGFVQQYKDGGWIARWSSPGYANLMVGTSSDVAFADAYLKDITTFDVRAAYEAALKNATVAPPNQNIGRKGFASSIFLGYTADESTDEAMSWAMDGYINDFGIANMAQKLFDQTPQSDPKRRAYKEAADYFRERALNYVHMFDPNVAFFQGRMADGSWRLPPEDYDPRVWGFDYTETNGWNMAFHVPHDGQGLANLYGGRDELAAKLDEFFATPETAGFPGSYGGIIHEMREARDVRMGQYGHSNQPSHHIIYMYDYAGQPWKTQALVREALSRLYIGSEIGQGYPGDEDNGEMSAWQVFSALGLYPLQMGSPYYAIGSPLFTKATVHLENGRDLVINAPANSRENVYVQGLRVNGQARGATFLAHDVIAAGAVLDFDMGPTPSTWGTGANDAPPSMTSGGDVPRPFADQTGGDAGTPTASDGANAAALFDNTSGTRATFASQTPWIQYRFDERRKVRYYTLTSAAQATTIPGSIADRVVAATASAENPPNEPATNLADGDSGTKWLAFATTGWARFQLSEPTVVRRYALTSANDAPTRDPRDWRLQGSPDGTTWTTLDSRSGEVFADRFQTRIYEFANDQPYLYYRLDITANSGASSIQLAELQLSDGSNATSGDPRSWVLKGSNDGVRWTALDERTDEAFPWRLQTRPFRTARQGMFSHYRIEFIANTGEARTSLAEVELMD